VELSLASLLHPLRIYLPESSLLVKGRFSALNSVAESAVKLNDEFDSSPSRLKEGTAYGLGELSSAAVFIENPHERSRLSRRKVHRNAELGHGQSSQQFLKSGPLWMKFKENCHDPILATDTVHDFGDRTPTRSTSFKTRRKLRPQSLSMSPSE
jgi:hypothetical protein